MHWIFVDIVCSCLHFLTHNGIYGLWLSIFNLSSFFPQENKKKEKFISLIAINDGYKSRKVLGTSFSDLCCVIHQAIVSQDQLVMILIANTSCFYYCQHLNLLGIICVAFLLGAESFCEKMIPLGDMKN